MFTDINDLHRLTSWKNRKDKRGVFEPRAVVTRGAKPAGIFKRKSPNNGQVINGRAIPNVTASGQIIKDLSEVLK